MTYDAVILGTGHNALILQACLGKAGLSTISLDRRDVAGGGLETVERPAGSGMRHNFHSFYHRNLTNLPWYRELNLKELGAVYLEPDLNVAMLLPDGRALAWWTDFEKTAASFAQFSVRDADSLRRWRDKFRPIVRDILVPESQSPPAPPEERNRRLAESESGRRLLEVSRLSPLEFVLSEFEHRVVQAGLLFFNGLREVDLRSKGFGHHIPALLASDGMAQMCVGGSKRLAEALLAAVSQAGGEVRLGVDIQRIIVEGGRAAGIELRDGEVIEARRLVASSLDPQQTFLKLLRPGDVPDTWRRRAESFAYNELAPLFSLHVNLRSPPHYAVEDAAINDAFMVIMGLSHVDQFHDIIAHHQRGAIPPTVMWGSCPTRFDPSQGASNRHTAFMWEKLPYRLSGDPANWESEKERHAQTMLRLWQRHAPNLAGDVIETFTQTPHDIHRKLWNMREGDLLVGAFSGGQVGYHRPFLGAGHYRGHCEGLYLCGSCCHPGGNITGLPGYNAAQVVMADLKI